MNLKSVKKIADLGLCISCGMCKAVCPENCITYKNDRGMLVPEIDSSCIICSRCLNVCPGACADYSKEYLDLDEKFWIGKYRESYYGRSRDEKKQCNGTSGGTVTELISRMLIDGLYNVAFLVKDHEFCGNIVTSEPFRQGSDLSTAQKSRYLIVSQTKAVSHIINFQNERVIFVGTGCIIQGIINVIEMYNLKRDNYLLLGLFCDRTMHMNVVSYFRNYSKNSVIFKKMYFRDKDNGGWPGGMRFIDADDTIIDLPNTERMIVKDFFQPERCLYCLDKMNHFADIALGDDYSGLPQSKIGRNTIIIRSENGLSVWNRYKEYLEYEFADYNSIYTGQKLGNKIENYFFSIFKEKEIGLKINKLVNNIYLQHDYSKYLKYYKKRILYINAGREYVKSQHYVDKLLFKIRLKYKIIRILSLIMKFIRHTFLDNILKILYSRS